MAFLTGNKPLPESMLTKMPGSIMTTISQGLNIMDLHQVKFKQNM